MNIRFQIYHRKLSLKHMSIIEKAESEDLTVMTQTIEMKQASVSNP